MLGYYVGGQHRSVALVGARIPFNPILGETLQLQGPSGEMFYGEQISHHPPITAFQLEGPGKCYTFSGSYESKMSLSGIDSVKGTRVGNIVFSFPDGGRISVQDPQMQMVNLLSSKKVLKVSGQMIITDHVNNLVAEFIYTPEVKEGYFSKKKEAFDFSERSDYFRLKIYEEKPDGSRELRAEGDGSFLSYI